MTRVFIVTSGNYSDYCVNAVFSKESLALDFCKKHMAEYHYAKIEEYKLDEAYGQKDRILFSVLMEKNGNVVLANKVRGWMKTGIEFYGRTGKENLGCVVWARDRKHAIKIINEKRGMLIATNQWGKESLT